MSVRSVSRGQGVISVALVAAFIGGCTGSPPGKPGSGSAGSGGGNTGTGGSTGAAGIGGSTGTAGKGGAGAAGTGGSTGTAGKGGAGNGAGATAGSGATGTAGAQGNGGTGAGGSSACANPQTSFGFTGQGDTNPHFNSAVGARSTNALFLFSGYNGPDPNGDGGASNGGAMFAQAFNPSTAASLGPSKLLILGVNSGGPQFSFLYSAAIAPTGQIAVLSGGWDQGVPALSAAFLTPSSDAGVGLGGGVGLQVERQVVVVSSTWTSGGTSYPPQVIWSNASNSFVVSYMVNNNGLHTAISQYSTDGAAVAGGALVPTDSIAGTGSIRPSAGVSGNLVGVPFLSTLSSTKNYPGLTVLNLEGIQVGSSIYLANATVASGPTIAVAGAPQGFVAAYSEGQSATEPSATFVTFIPTSSSGIVTDGGAFPTMTLTGGATSGAGLLAVGDDVGIGGANGVGVALDYDSGLSFAYVSADGSQVLGPISVLPYVGSGQFSITNYNGSTVLTLSGSNNNSAQIAASGCH
jgi:hypothetical protein